MSEPILVLAIAAVAFFAGAALVYALLMCIDDRPRRRHWS